MAKKLLNLNESSSKHHYIRTIFSSFFGFIALALILLSIVAVWLDRTLTGTDTFVKTTAPLISKPAVQDFIVEQARNSVLNGDNAPINDIAVQLLGTEQVAGKTPEQLKTEVTPVIDTTLKSVISSPAYASLWTENNRAVHNQLISQIESNSPTVNLNFNPLIRGTVDQLNDTKLSFIKDNLDLDDSTGNITFQNQELDAIHKGYAGFKKGVIAVLAAAAVAAVLSVVLSVHHIKTLRRIAMSTGIFSLALAFILSASSFVNVTGTDEIQKQFILTLFDSLTKGLRNTLIIVGVVSIAGALISKVFSIIPRKKQSA